MSNNTAVVCHEFTTEKWLLASGEMPQDRQELWQHHLQYCARCQEVLVTVQAVQTQYASLPLYEAPERLIRSLVSELWSTLGQYDAGLSYNEWSFDDLAESAAISTFDQQVADLRESLSTMSSELARAKL